MITGASQADAALLLVDVAEGVREQTLRHAYLLHLLGIRQVVVVINKMDRVGYDDGRFREIKSEVTTHLAGFGLKPAAVIPISARHGDGIVERSAAIGWYQGPTVIEALDRFAPAPPATALPLRLPVQAVYRFDDRRIVAGRIQSGRIAVGDEIALAPSGKRAVVRSIEVWPGDDGAEPREADAGQSVGIMLDRELFVARGDVIAHAQTRVPSGRRLKARIFWLHDSPLNPGTYVSARIGAAEARGAVTSIRNTLDPGDQSGTSRDTAGQNLVGQNQIGQNQIGEVEIALSSPIAADPYEANPRTGRVVLDVGGHIAGGGLVLALEDESRTIPVAGEESRALAARAADLEHALDGLGLTERLAVFRNALDGAIVFTTSFGLEDQIILHHICEAGLDIKIVTLDTGRLFPETYVVWEETERRYGCRVGAIYPHQGALERLVTAQGINGFYHAKEARIACCDVRKVEPLGRALAGAQGWITGLRAGQSADRAKVDLVIADEARNLLKFNPLIDWSRHAAEDFAAANQIPINVLHQRGFLSIGCAPCTRAVQAGEPDRAGRWWWEQDGKTECGLHVKAGALR